MRICLPTFTPRTYCAVRLTSQALHPCGCYFGARTCRLKERSLGGEWAPNPSLAHWDGCWECQQRPRLMKVVHYGTLPCISSPDIGWKRAGRSCRSGWLSSAAAWLCSRWVRREHATPSGTLVIALQTLVWVASGSYPPCSAHAATRCLSIALGRWLTEALVLTTRTADLYKHEKCVFCRCKTFGTRSISPRCMPARMPV